MSAPTEKRLRVLPGAPSPLGARFDGRGVNFAVYSEHGTRAWVCLFDPADPSREVARHELWERTGHVFHGYLPGVAPGTPYGLRVEGPFSPREGHRFNPHKLLLDPYARAVVGALDWRGPIFGFPGDDAGRDLVLDARDSAPFVPRGIIIIDDRFDRGADRRPGVPWSDTIIYELHVRGFTMRHPEVPDQLRGTYAGLAHPPVVEYLKRLGVTSIELMPVQEFVDEGHLLDRGLRNYWGYNPLAFFAPAQRYASAGPGAQVREFKEMVKALHAAGLEVIVDVVFNHTAEGNERGPTLSWRGLDNLAYYHLSPDDRRYYMNFSGCGNTLNLGSLPAMRLVIDCLRYWVEEMHVDGFRFDAAASLGRRLPFYGFDPHAAFMQALQLDSVLSSVKLIAEPWDVGWDAYHVGDFPVCFSEWNGKYRDAVRRFWRGDENQIAEMGYRLTGSADLYQRGGRRPHASINYVASHDGFTLHDLVSYNHKRNEANGEGNRDGQDDNYSWNWRLATASGPSSSSRGASSRSASSTACSDTIASSAAIASGTLVSRTSRGFGPTAPRCPREDWQKPFVRSVAFLLGGDALVVPDEHGRVAPGDSLLVLLNAHHEAIDFVLPAASWGEEWETLADTASFTTPPASRTKARGRVTVKGRSMMILRQPPPGARP
jgi:glycogen operon protein